ncbi:MULTISPECIES: HAMP domain-containing sensor histidine kinase [Rahnella]|uniref:histidine kinase n=1 Tax=Rahnella sp. (strain Y9602) TaxID=2703885 RepID=A0A0H3F9M2_RAHSY|nr:MULTISPECIES: ATP-binding protein [Rahnella]AFE57310.1 integral membrane sensor signal transduction histidine kinase [Rahnella aquatilis HX2]AYA06071.1 HAMP domain-containing protein [Rahnella aquatilis]ADW72725.1 integral membrane sensor signal transduction histidine kinase [Rahnella aceris]AZP41307.1 HAMP domain-containing protein [Rahnella aquatilis]AZP45648.1 HAMP domain-containing protein [Rahnella aquatilis]
MAIESAKRLRGRLFWKILLGFWFTFVAITQGLWVVFAFYNPHEPPESGIARRFVKLQITSAVSTLHYGGLPALNAMMADWPQDDRQFFSVSPSLLPAKGNTIKDLEPGKIPHEVVQFVQGPDGQGYRLKYDVDGLMHEYRPRRHRDWLNMPPPLLWLGGLGGLLFSAVLAWNLTRPMLQMRKAFGRVAQGDLSVRLFTSMGKRHDELSEVARDFDSMAERLQVLVKAREELLHDVSHELRSPLARLQLAIGLARQNPSNVESSLSRIEHEAGRLDKMIGELLALSRTESSEIPDEEYFDLYGLVEAVVNDARYEAQLPGVEIAMYPGSPDNMDYTVKGNAELMRRAVDNVVRNALRFSARGQTISVSLAQVEQYLQIEVADQGPGVEEDKLSSIFDPFVRVKSPLSGKGYGLGLAITRKVMLAHEGKVDARNAQPHGLIISLQVPHWQM